MIVDIVGKHILVYIFRRLFFSKSLIGYKHCPKFLLE